MNLAVHENEMFWLLHVEKNAGLLFPFRPHLGSKYLMPTTVTELQ